MNWGSVADWVSGLGSFAAVVTALYLATDSQKIKLDGYCGLRLLIGGGTPEQEFLWISVTNVGSRTAIVNNVGMTVGRRKKKRHAIITVSKDPYSDGLPVSLADGQFAKWGIPMTNDRKWIKDLVGDGFVKTEDDVDTLRFLVYTTQKAVKELNPEEPLREAIRTALKAKNA